MACVKRTQDGYSIYRVVSEEKSLNTSEAADGTESLHYELNRWEQDGMLCMDGYLYADDVNSFASNIYVGIMAPDGSEQFYYAMQYYSGFTEDNWNGAYGSFSCEVPMPGRGEHPEPVSGNRGRPLCCAKLVCKAGCLSSTGECMRIKKTEDVNSERNHSSRWCPARDYTR